MTAEVGPLGDVRSPSSTTQWTPTHGGYSSMHRPLQMALVSWRHVRAAADESEPGAARIEAMSKGR